MRFTFLIASLSLCACSSIYAQDSGEPDAKKPRGPVAFLVATSIPDDLENPVKVLADKEIAEVTLSKRSTSGPVEIPEDRIFRIIRQVTPDPEDPEAPAYVTLAQALIPEGVRKALIILVPTEETEEGLIFRTKVLDLATFTGGDYLYLNLCPVNVAVELGDWKSAIKPGETKIYDAPALGESTNVAVRYSFLHPTQQKWKMLSASTVVLRPTRREICIFSWDTRFGRINYHGVTFPVSR